METQEVCYTYPFSGNESALFIGQRQADHAGTGRGEHVTGRRTTQAVVVANNRYRNGDASALADISANLAKLVGFCPEHIQKEDKVFFPVIRNYLSDEEDQSMLTEFWEFDRKMIHEKYLSIVRALENA